MMPPRLPARLLVALTIALLAAPTAAAQSTSDRIAAIRRAEQQVRSMPLEQRPNRIGHVYGNNVRRLRHGTLCVNCQSSQRPLARFFYAPR